MLFTVLLVIEQAISHALTEEMPMLQGGGFQNFVQIKRRVPYSGYSNIESY